MWFPFWSRWFYPPYLRKGRIYLDQFVFYNRECSSMCSLMMTLYSPDDSCASVCFDILPLMEKTGVSGWKELKADEHINNNWWKVTLKTLDLLKISPERWEILQNHIDCSLHSLFSTCWSGQVERVKPFVAHRPGIKVALRNEGRSMKNHALSIFMI